MAQSDRVEVIGKQKGLFGEDIDITQFKNLKEKRELKEKVLKKFKGNIFRSIIKADKGNKRLDKLDRLKQKDHNGNKATMERADSFGKKTLKTLSTFPEVITSAYTLLHTEEGDKVWDSFCGHNSRATGVLAMNRKYTGFDVHTLPYNFTIDACKKAGFNPEDYNIHLQSSEKTDYLNESFDFAITSPPYYSVEPYCRIYNEQKEEDLSSKSDEDFLWCYNNCIKEMFRVLKKGSKSVIVVGDSFSNGKMKSLMLDTIKICKLAGFELFDINIYNRGSNIGSDLNPVMFLTKIKRFGCIHEYILIFTKPK